MSHCGLYYKHVTIVNDSVIKWSFKLIDAARGVIYDRHVFIIQATGVIVDQMPCGTKVIVRQIFASTRVHKITAFLWVFRQYNILVINGIFKGGSFSYM